MKLSVKPNLANAKAILDSNGYSLYDPYQIEGVEWLCNRELNCNPKGGLLCDEMGLGKTIQILSMMLVNKFKNTLIVMPANLIGQWQSEIKKFIGDSLNIIVHHGSKMKDASILNNDKLNVVISTYGLLARNSNSILHSICWDRIILEECHLIRNSKSQTAKSVYRLQGKYKWGITGTPVHNSMNDLYSIFKFFGIDKSIVKKYKSTITKKWILRRTKKDLEGFNKSLYIPKLEVEHHTINYDSKEEELFYNKVKNDVKKNVASMREFEFNMVHILELLLRLRQACIMPQLVLDGYSKKWNRSYKDWNYSNTKLDYVVKHVTTNSAKERPIIFAQFKKEIAYLEMKLLNNNMKVERIDGSKSLQDRNAIISRCKDVVDKEDKNYVDVIIIQIDSGSTGLNLQMFNAIWFTAIIWNPAIEMQAIARSHRLGQISKVIVRKVIMSSKDKTIEEKIIGSQDIKRELMADILNDSRLKSRYKRKMTIRSALSLLR